MQRIPLLSLALLSTVAASSSLVVSRWNLAPWLRKVASISSSEYSGPKRAPRMASVFFITHPDVLIDPAVPVPDWPLSPRGVARMHAMLGQPWIAGIVAVCSSTERKARDGAAILAAHLGLLPVARADLGENDRSATGYLPKPQFEATADAFFAHPETSVRGWERAIDAQLALGERRLGDQRLPCRVHRFVKPQHMRQHHA